MRVVLFLQAALCRKRAAPEAATVAGKQLLQILYDEVLTAATLRCLDVTLAA
jgi:hypothetical protein